MKLYNIPHKSNLLIAAAVSLLAVTGCGEKKSDKKQPDQVYEVVRGDFNVVVSIQGSLDAVKRYLIEAPSIARQGLDIIEAVPDQTVLKKGDQIVAFSDEVYLQELDSEKVDVEEAKKDLMVLEQDYQIAVADIVSAIKSSTDSLRQATEAYEKYVYEDAPLDKENLMLSVKTARKNVDDERANLASLKSDLLSASSGDEAAKTRLEGQVETSEQRIEELKRAEEKALYNLRIFKQYTFPQQERRLAQSKTKAEMDLQKQLVNSAAKQVQLDTKIATQKSRVSSLEYQMSLLVQNIGMLKITAPVDGTISYGDPDPRRRYGEQKEIVVGTTMNRREIIGSIPDLSQLIVNVDVPEASRSKVKVGMRAEMRIKALPNVKLSGVVQKVSDMATNLVQFEASTPKIYPTVIQVDQTDPNLRPGMTVEVDMISEVISDVIYLPVEALYPKEGKVYCNILKGVGTEEREVTTGRSSNSYVEITNGLKEGDRVMLSREES
ncbi:MAG: efflux RND transporter periplasmic adaptor subunit [Pontiellaceae bacterium]|nr:efflux RND transporter periplasmic adaptor subunit [Pontiellaceae bacterium]